jgi:hypothetical protein
VEYGSAINGIMFAGKWMELRSSYVKSRPKSTYLHTYTDTHKYIMNVLGGTSRRRKRGKC